MVSNYDSKIWLVEREKILVELTEKKVKNGNINITTFTKIAWKTIWGELNKKAKFNYIEN